jgi:hypothetical protein
MPLVFQMKQIRPQKLNNAAMRKQLTAAMKEAATEIHQDFRATTKTWKKKPKFVKEMDLSGPGPVVIVGTDNEVYTYVDEGTRPHPIYPRRAKALKFRWGGKGSYRPKTQVRVIDSFSGGATGKMVSFKSVWHPGTKARKFADEIEKRRRPWYKRRMEQAMRDAAKSSGHGG